jgi:hypothetical protein
LLGDAQSSLGDAQSSLGDAQSSLGDTQSSLGDAKSLLGDAESSLGDAKSSLSDAKSSPGDAESSLGDAESSLGDAKSSLGDAQSLAVCVQELWRSASTQTTNRPAPVETGLHAGPRGGWGARACAGPPPPSPRSWRRARWLASSPRRTSPTSAPSSNGLPSPLACIQR